jgi:hypothetical protein
LGHLYQQTFAGAQGDEAEAECFFMVKVRGKQDAPLTRERGLYSFALNKLERQFDVLRRTGRVGDTRHQDFHRQPS